MTTFFVRNSLTGVLTAVIIMAYIYTIIYTMHEPERKPLYEKEILLDVALGRI